MVPIFTTQEILLMSRMYMMHLADSTPTLEVFDPERSPAQRVYKLTPSSYRRIAKLANDAIRKQQPQLNFRVNGAVPGWSLMRYAIMTCPNCGGVSYEFAREHNFHCSKC